MWTEKQPEQDGHYWLVEPDADAPTVVKVRGGCVTFLEKDWDYNPPADGQMYWSVPIAKPEAPDPISLGENRWNHDWPKEKGLYWTSDSALGVRLARYTKEWCGWLGTEDIASPDDLDEGDFVFAERVMPPGVPVETLI
jgi:hypothetical protein